MQKSFAMAALLAASCGAQAASDADLAAIRAQIDDMKKTYEQRIAALEQKLVQAESRTASPAKPAPPAPVENRPSVASANAFNPEVSLILQGQYRHAKNIEGRGITGFVPGGEGLNTRGFSVDETELVLAANIDPYWRGQAIVAMADGQANIEEAWFQSLAIGQGVGLKVGRFRAGIGYLNEQHPHMWDFADAPLMYQAMFGEDASYVQDGVQLKWLAPTALFVEVGAEVGRGANFPGTDRNNNGTGGGALHVHAGDDVGVSNSWRAGASWLKTRASERTSDFVDIGGATAQGAFAGDSTTWLADFVWKWAPNGNSTHRNFKFQSEYFVREEKGGLTCVGACVDSSYKTNQSGWYAQGVYQFTPQWRAGLRYEQLDSGTRDFGANAANLVVDSYRPKKASAMVDYSWSEFSRLRLQVAQDKSMLGITDNQLTLQYVMSLGAHGAHKF
ncbi:MAG: TonB-dependent receptor [Gammaproteobacteria bacterium]|nr:TonB-dependent receptor [Gammaproteobacteria bacterium]MBU1600668.1 TonB-dependent receptor [Gammaproteobacteria bacterium]MBU2435124.1 TonB-dependent receptor [Gammaproteobacteria bacterium]MBU2448360.1 TonB-dependent receptor [Gammaproteobacteria bacterium]